MGHRKGKHALRLKSKSFSEGREREREKSLRFLLVFIDAIKKKYLKMCKPCLLRGKAY